MININLIAERRTRRLREMTTIRISILVIVCIAVIMILFNLGSLWEAKNYRDDLRVTEKNRRDIEGDYQRLLKVRTEIAQKAPLVTLLRQVQISESAWITILTDLSRILPNNVAIDTISTESSTQGGVNLHLAGRGTDENAVADFMQRLPYQTRWAGTPSLNGMNTELMQGQGRATVHFDVKVPINGMIGGDL